MNSFRLSLSFSVSLSVSLCRSLCSSLCVFLCPSLPFSVGLCLPPYLSSLCMHLCVCLFVCLFVSLCLCVSQFVYVCASVCMSVRSTDQPSVCMFVSLSLPSLTVSLSFLLDTATCSLLVRSSLTQLESSISEEILTETRDGRRPVRFICRFHQRTGDNRGYY